MGIEFRKITNPKTCMNNSFILADYELDANGILLPLCDQCVEQLLQEISEVLKKKEIPVIDENNQTFKL